MAAKNGSKKFKIKEIANGKIIEREAVDAKECVATGLFEYVASKPLGTADWIDAPRIPDEVEEQEDYGVTEKEVKSMNTSELEEFVEENELEIEGFSTMNLKDKRAAVAELIKGE